MHGEKTTLSFTGPAAQMADIWAAAKSDPLAWLTGSRAAAPATVTTNVIIELPDYLKILAGDGDDIRLAMTNGATITGAELVRRTLAGAGLSRSSTRARPRQPLPYPAGLREAASHARGRRRPLRLARLPTPRRRMPSPPPPGILSRRPHPPRKHGLALPVSQLHQRPAGSRTDGARQRPNRLAPAQQRG